MEMPVGQILKGTESVVGGAWSLSSQKESSLEKSDLGSNLYAC